MSKFTLYLVAIYLALLFPHVVYGQINEPKPILPDSTQSLEQTAVDSVLADSVQRTTDSTIPTSDSLSKVKADFKVFGWNKVESLGNTQILSDSLWRWRLYSDITDRLVEIDGTLPHRRGVQLREDAFLIGNFDPSTQQLFWFGMPMNDAVSGGLNSHFLPLNKIRSLDYLQRAGRSELHFANRTYNVSEPWSRLYFEESEGEYQNLEFMITRNFSKRWNTEIGYRQIRDGNLYRGSNASGSQLFLQNTYQINQKWRLIQQTYRADYDINEPGGYQLSDPAQFPFNPFTAQPLVNASESPFFSVQRVRVEHRVDSLAKSDASVQVYRKKNNRSFITNTDTTDYTSSIHGLTAEYRKKLAGLDVDIRLISELQQFSGTVASISMPTGGLNNQVFAQLSYTKGNNKVFVETEWVHQTLLNASLDPRLRLGVIGQNGPLNINEYSLSVFSRKMQHSLAERLLLNQQHNGIQAEGIDLNIKWVSDKTQLNIEAAIHQISDQTVFDPVAESSFKRLNPTLISASYALDWQPSAFYASHSMRFQRREDPVFIDQRLFSRAVVGWKNYAFKRATFLDLNVELRNDLLPFYGMQYHPVLGNWQQQSSLQIPAFRSVLDLNLSARLRSIMVLVRWENLLDEVTQLGYFESFGYPAPYRRLMFGIRALFKN